VAGDEPLLAYVAADLEGLGTIFLSLQAPPDQPLRSLNRHEVLILK